jgi:hypothetical protein
MADFSVKTTVTPGQGDYRWLRSRHAADNTVSATLVRALLTAGTHYDTNGIIPSGLALGKLTGKAEYGPYDPTATDGRQYLAGFLLDPEQLQADFGGITTVVTPVAMFVEGIVDPVYLPGTPVLNTKTPTTGRFVFAGVDYAA